MRLAPVPSSPTSTAMRVSFVSLDSWPFLTFATVRYRRFVGDTLVDLEEDDVAARVLVESYGRAVTQGEILFREGEPATHAFLLHEGRFRLLKRVRMVERSLTVLRSGDLFGEGALVDGALRSSTAVALSDGIVLVLDRAALRGILQRFPRAAEKILTQLVKRLRDAEDQIEVLMLRDTQS